MKLLSNILYLDFSDLKGYGVSEGYLFKVCNYFREFKSTSWNNIPDPTDARKKLIAYDSIPLTTKTKYGIPAKELLLQNYYRQSLTNCIKTNTKDLEYFLANAQTHPHAYAYARKAAWFEYLAPLGVKKCREMGFKDFKELLNLALILMKEEVKPTYSVCNWRVLSRDLKPFEQIFKGSLKREDALKTIINKHNTNRSAYKIKEEQQQLLIQIYSDGNSKPNMEQTWMIYTRKANELIKQGRWDKSTLVTEQCIANTLQKPENIQLWYGPRHGYGEARNLFDHVLKRKRASFANAKWVIDGTAWHRYYNIKGNAYARLNVFVVLDEYSWTIIGFCASFSESSEQVIRSLHQACIHAKAMPYQLQYDNSAAIQSYRSQECIEKLVKYNVATEVGNARAKMVEAFFKHFNEDVLKFWSGYTGSPFMSTKLDGKGNREAIAAMIKQGELADEQQAINDLNNQFNLWNSLPWKKGETVSRLERYRKSMVETAIQQREFTHMTEVEAFWEMPGIFENVKIPDNTKRAGFRTQKVFRPREYTYTNKGIQVQTGTERREYDVNDTNFWAKNIGEKFNIKLNPENPDRIYLYQNGKPVADDKGAFMVLKEKEEFHSAMVDHTEGEMALIRQANINRKTHLNATKERYADIIKNTKEIGIYTPVKPENIYDKDTLNRAKAMIWESELAPPLTPPKNGGEHGTIRKISPSIHELYAMEAEEDMALEHEYVLIEEPKKISRWEL